VVIGERFFTFVMVFIKPKEHGFEKMDLLTSGDWRKVFHFCDGFHKAKRTWFFIMIYKYDNSGRK